MLSFPLACGGARILIAEANGHLRQDLQSLFEVQRYRVEACGDGRAAAERVVDPSLDLILLAADLDDVDGWQLLARLRRCRSTPVILLAPPGASQSDCIAAFEQGADDFMIKPVDPVELKLRTEALLRRTSRPFAAEAQPGSLLVGPLALSRANQSVCFGTNRLSVTPVQFKLLWSLAQHHNEVLSRAHLHQIVLGKSFCQHDRSVDMHLSRVRRKLVSAGMPADCLLTVRGQGYCLSFASQAVAHAERAG